MQGVLSLFKFGGKQVETRKVNLSAEFPSGMSARQAEAGMEVEFRIQNEVVGVCYFQPSGGTFYARVLEVKGGAALLSFWQSVGPVHHGWVRRVEDGRKPECFMDYRCTMQVAFPRDATLSLESR